MRLVRKLVAPTIWIILFSFLFFGVENLVIGLRKETQAAGKVFGKTVTWKEYRDSLRSAEFFLQTPEKSKTPAELETAAWQNIALLIEADREHITVSDDEVRSEIKTFFGGQVPSPEIYQKWTTQTLKEHPYDFEERVRKAMKTQKLMALHKPKAVTPAPEKSNEKTKEPAEAEKGFTSWLQDVMKRAKIEKFKTAEESS